MIPYNFNALTNCRKETSFDIAINAIDEHYCFHPELKVNPLIDSITYEITAAKQNIVSRIGNMIMTYFPKGSPIAYMMKDLAVFLLSQNSSLNTFTVD